MRIDLNWKKVAIASGVAGVIILSNAAQYFVITKPNTDKLQSKYNEKIAILQGSLDAIGPLTPVWVVRSDLLDITAGREIKEDDLELKELPEAFIGEGYILDPAEVLGKYYKLAIGPGTPLLRDLVLEEPMDNTVREFDVVISNLPIGLKPGDFVDYRLVYPKGEDYIVLSHKRVHSINGQTVKMHLNEEEIHLYQAAIVDYYLQMQKGSMNYLAKYVEPGAQEPARRYYSAPAQIVRLMEADPNIVAEINKALHENGRKVININVGDVTQEEGAAINAGRNDLKSKLDAGQTEAENKAKEEENLQQELQNQQQQQGAGQVVQPPTAPPTSDGVVTPPLEIEEGVVE